MTYTSHNQLGDKRAYVTMLGDLTLYFSYDTLIGATYNGRTVRRPNGWGPTTGRHMNIMGLRNPNVPEVTEEQLAQFVEDAILDMGMKRMHQTLTSEV